jgi:hypothetical protein
VGEITLRGAMTDQRAGLDAWINETVNGKPWKRNVSITALLNDGTVSETVTYIDCTISAYRPPRLALPPLDDPCGPDKLKEEVRFIYRDWTIRA